LTELPVHGFTGHAQASCGWARTVCLSRQCGACPHSREKRQPAVLEAAAQIWRVRGCTNFGEHVLQFVWRATGNRPSWRSAQLLLCRRGRPRPRPFPACQIDTRRHLRLSRRSVLSLKNDLSNGLFRSVRDAHSDVLHAEGIRDFLRFAFQRQRGSAAALPYHFQIDPTHAAAPTGAEGFHGSFFHSEPARVTFEAILKLLAIGYFIERENTPQEALFLRFNDRGNAFHFRDVNAHADNHASPLQQRLAAGARSVSEWPTVAIILSGLCPSEKHPRRRIGVVNRRVTRFSLRQFLHLGRCPNHKAFRSYSSCPLRSFPGWYMALARA